MPWGSVSDRVIGVAKDIYIGANLTFGGTEASDRDCHKHTLIVTAAATYNLLPSAVAKVTRVWSQMHVSESQQIMVSSLDSQRLRFLVTFVLFGSLPRR